MGLGKGENTMFTYKSARKYLTKITVFLLLLALIVPLFPQSVAAAPGLPPIVPLIIEREGFQRPSNPLFSDYRFSLDGHAGAQYYSISVLRVENGSTAASVEAELNSGITTETQSFRVRGVPRYDSNNEPNYDEFDFEMEIWDIGGFGLMLETAPDDIEVEAEEDDEVDDEDDEAADDDVYDDPYDDTDLDEDIEVDLDDDFDEDDEDSADDLNDVEDVEDVEDAEEIVEALTDDYELELEPDTETRTASRRPRAASDGSRRDPFEGSSSHRAKDTICPAIKVSCLHR